jgi:hypothetical protein
MTSPKTIDRRNLLTSTVTAWAAVTWGCSGSEADGGGTGGMGAAGTGGTGAGTGGGAGIGGSTGGGAGTGTGGSAAGTGGSAAGTGGSAGTSNGGAGAGGSAGTGIAGSGTSGAPAGGAGSGGVSTGGTAGSDEGGMGGAPPERMCTADTKGSTDHSHPLTVPGADVDRGAQDGPYTLEDGGTGHTHQLFVSAYDFLYLAGGTAWMIESTETEGHTHTCTITCPIP